MRTKNPFEWTVETPLRSIIGQALGAASVCWDPKPEGVFQAELALEVLEDVMTALHGKGIDD